VGAATRDHRERVTAWPPSTSLSFGSWPSGNSRVGPDSCHDDARSWHSTRVPVTRRAASRSARARSPTCSASRAGEHSPYPHTCHLIRGRALPATTPAPRPRAAARPRRWSSLEWLRRLARSSVVGLDCSLSRFLLLSWWLKTRGSITSPAVATPKIAPAAAANTRTPSRIRPWQARGRRDRRIHRLQRPARTGVLLPPRQGGYRADGRSHAPDVAA
jgi:hypothetical protein